MCWSQKICAWHIFIAAFGLLIATWVFATIFINVIATSTHHPSRIVIEGSAVQRARILKALDLLQQKSQNSYRLTIKYIDTICIDDWNMYTPSRSYNSGTCSIENQTAKSSPEWLAAIIAHESVHARQYWEWHRQHGTRIPTDVWLSPNSEMEAIDFQTTVLRQVGGTDLELEILGTLDGTHNDANKDGVYDGQDMELSKRK